MRIDTSWEFSFVVYKLLPTVVPVAKGAICVVQENLVNAVEYFEMVMEPLIEEVAPPPLD